MRVKNLKNKVFKILSDISDMIDKRHMKTKNDTKINAFEEKKYQQSIQKKKPIRISKIKDVYSFKGSGYNGKGSVNTDTRCFTKSRK